MAPNTSLTDIKAEILDSSPVIVVLLDVDLHVIWANRAYQSVTKLPLSDIVGKKCFLCWEKDRPCPNCPVELTIKDGKSHEAIIKLPRPGEKFNRLSSWMLKASPLHDSQGKFTGSVATLFELPENTMQLERYGMTMASLMRLLKASVYHTSSELLRMFLDEAELLTESRIGFYHFVEEDQQTLSLQMWSTNTLRWCAAPGAGTHYPIEQAGVWVDCVRESVPVVHNDYAQLTHKKGLPEGHVPVMRELVVPVIRAGKLLAILGVGNKETDYNGDDVWVVEQLAAMAWEVIVRKKTEEENKILQEQFAQAQKLESVGRLAGGVAHDFNNMLSIINGYAELALDKIEDNSTIENDLQQILMAAKRSADITKKLLAFARKQTISPVPLDLNAAVSSMIKMLRRLIGENIDLIWRPASDLWLVNMDPIQIDQILANLCVNARDAIADIGELRIETRNVVLEKDLSEHHPEGSGDEYVVLEVSDNGCGMDNELVTMIFEPFFTTKELGRGTGLGLATVYGIVKQNGGFIKVESEPDKGTSFKIHIARYQNLTFPRQFENIDKVVTGQSETILVVEDEKAILELTRKILESLGYRVLTASTPSEAMDLVTKFGDAIQGLITDVILPEMNGKALADKIKAKYPAIPCLYMSGYPSDTIAHHGVLEENVNFLEKPFTKAILAVKVRELINGSTLTIP